MSRLERMVFVAKNGLRSNLRVYNFPQNFKAGACPLSPSRCVLGVHWMCPWCAHATCSFCKLDAQKEVYMHLLCWPTQWLFIPLHFNSIYHFCGRTYQSDFMLLWPRCKEGQLGRLKNDNHINTLATILLQNCTNSLHSYVLCLQFNILGLLFDFRPYFSE